MEIYGPAYCKNCTMPAIRNGYSARPCGLKHVKREGRKGAMSKTSFCLSSTSLYAGCGSDDQRRPRQGCAGPLGPNCSRWIMSGGGGGGMCARDLARIFAIAVGGLRSGLCGCMGPPGPHLWRWRMSRRARACLWRWQMPERGREYRPDLRYWGWWSSVGAARMRGAARAFEAVAGVMAGPRRGAVSLRSLLLRLVGFGLGCVGARGRPGPACGGGGSLGGAARARVLARIFAFAVCGLRLGLRVYVGPPRPY